MEVSNMDCKIVGRLISDLRKEKGITQKQLADSMNISDKTVSKWERGCGCPDVSLLHKLSEELGVSIEKILSGTLNPNDIDGGNMKKIKFYLCHDCGNIVTSTGGSDISCCGRKLTVLIPSPADRSHVLSIENIEDDVYITFNHEMSKKHYISFVAYASYDRVLFIKLYPEQGGEVRFPKMRGGKIYCCCSQHGLYYYD